MPVEHQAVKPRIQKITTSKRGILFQKTTWLTNSERDALQEYLQSKPQIRK
jgi:hypothetical protein